MFFFQILEFHCLDPPGSPPPDKEKKVPDCGGHPFTPGSGSQTSLSRQRERCVCPFGRRAGIPSGAICPVRVARADWRDREAGWRERDGQCKKCVKLWGRKILDGLTSRGERPSVAS